jgi:serine/threonine protein kinase
MSTRYSGENRHLLVDRLCDRLIASWRSGRPICIEALLEEVSENLRDSALEDLIAEECEQRCQAGERPAFHEYETRFRSRLEAALRGFRHFDPQVPALKELADRSATDLAAEQPLRDAFHFLQQLGCGAFGSVWLAHDLRLGRLVAIKVIRKSAINQLGRDAFRREAKIVASLSHPNIVSIYSLQTVAETDYLILQYVSGGSLQQRLRQEGAIPWSEAVGYIVDVSDGLMTAHQQGLVHRDIKPANILWERSGDVALLSDFGLAAWQSHSRPAGTLAYMAPEAFEGRAAPESDVYAMAATLYCLLTLQSPFNGKTVSEIIAAIQIGLPNNQPTTASIPDEIWRVIRAGLSFHAGDRPSLSEFKDSLRRALNRLLSDTLTWSNPLVQPDSAVELNLILKSRKQGGHFEELSTSSAAINRRTRDMKRVPDRPVSAIVRTGDILRIEALANRDGYLSVYNLGPTGNLNKVYPVGSPESVQKASRIVARQVVHIADVEIVPPSGRERLFAIWSPRPLEDNTAIHIVVAHEPIESAARRATRDMRRLNQSLQEAADCMTVVVEVEHVPHE